MLRHGLPCARRKVRCRNPNLHRYIRNNSSTARLLLLDKGLQVLQRAEIYGGRCMRPRYSVLDCHPPPAHPCRHAETNIPTRCGVTVTRRCGRRAFACCWQHAVHELRQHVGRSRVPRPLSRAVEATARCTPGQPIQPPRRARFNRSHRWPQCHGLAGETAVSPEWWRAGESEQDKHGAF